MSLAIVLISVCCTIVLLSAVLYQWRTRRRFQEASDDLKAVAELFRIKPLRESIASDMEHRPGFVWDDSKWRENDSKPLSKSANDVAVRIYSQNIWFSSERQEERAKNLLLEIRQQNAHVVAMMEVQSHVLKLLLDDKFVRETYAASNLEIEKGYGVALFVNRSFLVEFSELPLPTSMGRTCIFARLANGVIVATAHLESLENSKTRAKQAEAIFNIGTPDILIGDMNADASWNEELESVVERFKLTDAWGKQGGGFTRNGKRIDRAFITHRIKAQDVRVLDSRDISDHFGIVLDGILHSEQ